MDKATLGELRRLIRARLTDAARSGAVNVATAVNVDRSGHTTAVYSDNDVTIVQRDGETEVRHHQRERGES